MQAEWLATIWAMPLSHISKLKVHLGITGDTQDALLNQLLEEVESGVKMFLRGRRLDSHEVTEYFDGHGRARLILSERPVTGVGSVRVDSGGFAGHGTNAFGSESAWTIGVDFYPASLAEDEKNPGELIAISSVWPEGQGNIRAIYTAGYSNDAMPADVQLAVHQLVARVKAGRAQGGVMQSETLGSYSYTLLTGATDDAELLGVRSALMKYRNIAV